MHRSRLLAAATLIASVSVFSLHAQTAPAKKYSWDYEPTPVPQPATATPQAPAVSPAPAPAPATTTQPRYKGFDPVASVRESPESKSRFEISIAAAFVFDLGTDADNQDGWGMSANFLVLPPKPADTDWQMKYGLEFLYFSTSGDDAGFRETIDAGVLFLNFGGTYALTDYLEIGGVVGTGFGGSYGRTNGFGFNDSNGNANYAFQIKPMLVAHLSQNVQLYAAYRFAYIAPFVDTDLIGFDSVTMWHQSAEVGITWRF